MKKYLVMFIESTWHSLNVDDFNDYNTSHVFNKTDSIITFQSSDLIREFKAKKYQKLPNIIDLECFDKQMSQEGKEFKKYKKWTAIQLLKHHKIVDEDFKLTSSNFKSFMEHLSKYYLSQIEKDEDEKNRFVDLELKVNELIYKRQLKGVRINIELAKDKCRHIEKNIYNIKNKLQFDHQIYTPENTNFQYDYLRRKKYRIIESPKYTFKTRRNEDVICNLLYELIRNTEDLDSLLYTIAYFGGEQRTHPWYLGFGTITSRIILRQPSLQNLRRVNRDIIIPDENMSLFYIDYSQFEAGILASLSNDEKLIKLYNKDIYTDLADKVIGDKEKRDDAKILFYRYMYGDDTLNKTAKDYFNQFDQLNEFRNNINKQIDKKGKLGTSNGNYRCRFENDESSWSLSHLIQSTASLIYKNALISVRNKVKYSEFLIPMHDGTLYQLPNSNFNERKKKIEKIYLEEFKKVCPQIEVKVDVDKPFSVN